MKKKKNQRFSRKYDKRKEFRKIYIFTEGEKTEVNYFNSKKKEIETETRRKNIEIVVKGTGYNTLSLVDYALGYISKEDVDLSNLSDGDECWVVFDRDDFKARFDNAVRKAEAKNLKVAYSNVCFELWFLLHFNLMSSAIGRDDYIKKLSKNLIGIGGRKYKKGDTADIYNLIKGLEEDAIRNSKKLLNMHAGETSYLKKNPSTTVHLLVERLNALSTIG